MMQNKLLRLLSTFSTEELQRLRLFIESPFFNTNRNVTALYKYLVAFAPQFDDEALSGEAAFEAVFPEAQERPAKKEVIIKISSKLFALAEKFLEHESLQKEPFTGAVFRKRWFRFHSQPEWEAIALADMEEINRKRPFMDETYAQNRYLIEYERAKWEAATTSIHEKLDLSRLNFTLDEYYLRAKLECLCHMVNHFLVSNRRYDMQELDLVKNLVGIHEFSLMPETKLWLKALRLLEKPADQSRFSDLISTLRAYETLLPILEKQTFFVFLSNAARLTFPNPNEYSAELFALYRFQVDTDSLMTNGVIAPETLFNVLSIALRQKENDWAFRFMTEYEGRLDPGSEKKDDMLALCKSMVASALGQYPQALDYLNTTHFKDVQSKMTERRLRLKIYLELGYEDLFMDQAGSFRKFLTVNKNLIPPHHAEGNRNFITAILSLYRLQNAPIGEIEALRNSLTAIAVLPEKNWLEDKLQELSKSRKKHKRH